MTVQLTVFACPVCGQAITRPLAPLPADCAVCLEDGKAAVRQGFFALSDDDYWTGSFGSPLVNLADLVGTVHHPDTRRIQGCCGPSGCDGPNLVCGQGHEVGTERSDCWMAHGAVLLCQVTRRPVTG